MCDAHDARDRNSSPTIEKLLTRRAGRLPRSFVPAKRWVPLAIDQLANAKLSSSQRASALVVLSGLLHAAGKVQPPLSEDLVAQLTRALANEDVRGCDHPAVRMQLLAVVLNIARWVQAGCAPVSRQLYSTLLQLYGYEKDVRQQAAVKAALQELAVACGMSR